jgi:hypothetical protein
VKIEIVFRVFPSEEETSADALRVARDLDREIEVALGARVVIVLPEDAEEDVELKFRTARR